MATPRFTPVAFPQQGNSQCFDPSDMENWVDFGAMTGSSQGSSSKGKMPVTAMHPGITSPTSTALPLDSEDQTPVAPSHDYARFKQQTGLPTGAIAGLHELSDNQNGFNDFNSGMTEEFAFGSFDGMGSQSRFGSMTGDVGLDTQMPAMFYPGQDSQMDDFINPNAIQKQDEDRANIRYYPGMHQQQAKAMRAQQIAAQRQQLLAQQQAAERQRQSQRRSSHVSVDPHAEETIARVVNQIRQNSMMQASLSPEQNGLYPHMARSRKDEEDMDDDERLLNSEEGKKLSSKERRQLRNKVSARAFRSRRKEYIGQLEGEVAVKVNECNELKVQNRALMEENSRFRTLAEKLLGHAAFRPFLEELSRDPELAQSLTSVMDGQSSAPTPQPAKKDVNPYEFNGQQFNANQTQHVGMTLVPETQIDFSQLNLGGNSWNMAAVPAVGNTFQPQVFAILEIPEEPINVAALANKYTEQDVESETVDVVKHDIPQMETMETSKGDQIVNDVAVDVDEDKVVEDFDEHDPAFTLFATPSTPASKPTLEDAMDLVSQLPSSKPSEFELVSLAEEQKICADLEKACAKLDAACRRLDTMFSKLGL